MTDIQTVRLRPQQTDLYLSIYQPRTVFAAQVNDVSIARGQTTILFDTVSIGNKLSVNPGQTLWVGTSPDSYDIGKVRVREIEDWIVTGSLLDGITVARNSLPWENDLYLTIKDFHEIWAKPFTNLIVDDDVIFYKEGDIDYTNQNSVLGTLPCMGSHYAGFVGEGVYYTASGSYNVNGDALTYDWCFEGATVTGSTLEAPGYRYYNTPGHYTTRLTINNASGGSDTAYRHVSIYNRGDTIQNWGFQSEIAGSRDEGGYSCEIWMREDTPMVYDGALVVIFQENYYGSQFGSVGGNGINRSGIFFVGYIVEGSIQRNYATHRVSFSVESPSGIMSRRQTTSISVDDNADPTSWVQIQEMDCRKFLYHYLRWHTTVLDCMDLECSFVDRALPSQDTEEGTILDVVRNFFDEALKAEVVCDRQGKLWIEQSAGVVDQAASVLRQGEVLDNQDWVGEVEIEERLFPDVGYLEMGGVAYSGPATGTFTDLIASAPGEEYLIGEGSAEEIQGLLLLNQDDLNTLVGNYYAYRNARYPVVSMKLQGAYPIFDIAPLKVQRLTLAAGDTYRRLVWNQKPFHFTDLSYVWDPTGRFMQVQTTLHEITQGTPGVLQIPVKLPDYNIPQQDIPLEFPQIPQVGIPIQQPVTVPRVPNCFSNTGWIFIENGPFPLGVNKTVLYDGDTANAPFKCVIRPDAPHTYMYIYGRVQQNFGDGWINTGGTEVSLAVTADGIGGAGSFNAIPAYAFFQFLPGSPVEVSGFNITASASGGGTYLIEDPNQNWYSDEGMSILNQSGGIGLSGHTDSDNGTLGYVEIDLGFVAESGSFNFRIKPNGVAYAYVNASVDGINWTTNTGFGSGGDWETRGIGAAGYRYFRIVAYDGSFLFGYAYLTGYRYIPVEYRFLIDRVMLGNVCIDNQ